jgi:hypothetical protein
MDKNQNSYSPLKPIVSSSVIALFLLFPQVQPHISNAIIIHDYKSNTDLDTGKPIQPQYNSYFLHLKNASPIQFRNFTQHFGSNIENSTTVCNSPIVSLFPKYQQLCDTVLIPVTYIICQSDEIKQSVFECSDPRLNDYLSIHGIKDPDAYLRYGLEKMQRDAQSNSSTNNTAIK